MPIFNFYALENKASEERKDLFSAPADAVKTEAETSDAVNADKKPAYATPEECLGSFFETRHSLQLPVLKSSGKGEEKTTFWDRHKCDVLRHEDGVILMTVEANKSKHTTIDKKDVEHQHHPYSTVLIDNRPGHQMIGIERNSAFDGKPDKLADILQKGISHLLMPYGRKIELMGLKKNDKEFWPVIDRLRTHYQDEVRQIRLDLSGKNAKEVAAAGSLMSLISGLAAKTDSAASLILQSEESKEVRLQEVHDDLTHIAEICLAHKGYDLMVKFKKFGVYRYGADLLAQFGVDDEVLGYFENGNKEFSFDQGAPMYGLSIWLDKLNNLLNDYGKYTVQAKRKAPRRRKVS